MIVFVVNCGSSSIKYQLINMEGERVMAKGLIERIGMEGSTLKHTPAGKYTIDLKEEIPDHKVGIRLAIKALTSKEYGINLGHILDNAVFLAGQRLNSQTDTNLMVGNFLF